MLNYKNNKKSLKPLKDQQGIVTISFLLVLIIVLFFILTFFGLAMTFVHVSVSQYMSYSSARTLSLAGDKTSLQFESAIDRYKLLREQFFKDSAHTGKTGDWFDIFSEITERQIGFSGGKNRFNDGNPHQLMFYGVGTGFRSNVMNLKIPYLIKNESSIDKEARILSFLGREASQEECQDNFNKKRAEKISQEYSSLPSFEMDEDISGDNDC